MKTLGDSFQLVSPINPQERGSQVSYKHANAYAIVQALIDVQVIGDFRAPDTMRFGFAPLYTRFIDVFSAVEKLNDIVDKNTYMDNAYLEHKRVT